MKEVNFMVLSGFVFLLQAGGGQIRESLAAPVLRSVRSHSMPAAELPASQTIDHGGKIEARYDGFNHETVVALSRMQVTCRGSKGLESTLKNVCINLGASLHAPGKQLDYVRFATVQLIFESKDWFQQHPFDQRDLVVVADGQTLKLGRMRLVEQVHDTNKGVEVMKEMLEVSLPYETFKQIALAEVVEMKVGKSMFALGEKNLAALRDLNNRVKP